MRILGLDPGYAIFGYGVVDMVGNKFKPVEYGVVTTEANLPMEERLKIIYDSLSEIIERTRPDNVSIEELFFNTNSKTVINVSQARGVGVLACVNAGIPISEYTPLQIKVALVGYGRAEKKQVQIMTKTILNLVEIPKPDDAADALGAAICHGHSLNSNNRIQSQLGRK